MRRKRRKGKGKDYMKKDKKKEMEGGDETRK